MEAVVERLALAYLNVFAWPLRWLGEAWLRRLARALVAVGVLSYLLLPVTPAPFEAFLRLLLLPQQAPRLLGMAYAVCVPS